MGDEGVLNGTYGHCRSDCSGLGPHCGDGTTDAGNECDDGNAIDTDACLTSCVAARCGALALLLGLALVLRRRRRAGRIVA